MISDPKSKLLHRLTERQGEMIDFLRSLIRCRTPNPPGDTRPAIALIEQFLRDSGVGFEVVAPNPQMPNIVAQFSGRHSGPRLVLNGHVDVFPVGDEANWLHDPWGAEIEGDRIYGRGACDMKSGTTALLFAFVELFALRAALNGSVVLTIVSDEETFGPWGARHLVRNRPDVLGDCVLNSEPTSPFALRFGEKGPLWLRFQIRTAGAHGAYSHMSKNAIAIASEIISRLRDLTEISAPIDSALSIALRKNAAAIDRAYGAGASSIISAVTVNPGVITGGIKINMIPSECEFDVDIRIPPEVEYAEIMRRIEGITALFPEATYNVLNYDAANASQPDHKMVDLLIKNAQQISDRTPAPIIGLGGTDARLWRHAGIPAFVYGPSPSRMGASDEYVEIAEFMHVAKTHALSAFDFLTQ